MPEIIDGSVDNQLSRTLFDHADQILAVIDVLLASGLADVHYGCVEGHIYFFDTDVCENLVFMVFSSPGSNDNHNLAFLKSIT